MLSHAVVIGRSHRIAQQNCHDFAITGAPAPDTAFGLALDGCGSKFRRRGRAAPSHNEIGANLLGTFAAGFLNEQLEMSNEQKVEALLDDLYRSSLEFLANLANAFAFADEAARQAFIATRLLCTLVGFIKTRETAVFFWLGDGHLCCNGRVITLDSGNQPDYLAYRLWGEGMGDGFNLVFAPQPDEIEWLAVATDGWQAAELAQLAQPADSLALQRRVNVLARRRDLFDDDGGTAVWWRSNEQ